MTRPLLPPKGIFVPAHLIYSNSLPPVLLQTWIQLRGLAWGKQVTPLLTLKEVAALIGKGQSTLYRHMTQLRHLAALSWRTTGSGSLIVSFSDQPQASTDYNPAPIITNSQNQESPLPPGDNPAMFLNSQNREVVNPASLNHLINPDVLMIPVLEQENKGSDQVVRDESEAGGERECEGERGLSSSQDREPVSLQTGKYSVTPASYKPSRLPSPVPDPVSTYRSLAHLTPKASQRRILNAQVTDLRLWQETLEHWLMHGWNPHNLTGMLELYGRGGIIGCRYCHPESPPHSKARTPLQGTLAAIEVVRKRQAQSTHHE